jgi:uncharacterized membrane protein
MPVRFASQKASNFLNPFGAFFALLVSVLPGVLIVAMFAATH